jgi:hypothetical protein
MVPIEMAIPERATILASTLKYFIIMKLISTARAKGRYQQGGTQVIYHNDNHDDRDEYLQDYGIVKCTQGFVYQLCAVVERHYGYLRYRAIIQFT